MSSDPAESRLVRSAMTTFATRRAPRPKAKPRAARACARAPRAATRHPTPTGPATRIETSVRTLYDT
eukprot:2981422-Prymnesium_polylepis.1